MSVLTIRSIDEDFLAACRIRTSAQDPWLRRGIGLDSKGNLVVAGASAGSCRKVREGTYSALKLKSFQHNERDDFFAGSRLELIDSDGTLTILSPYEF